MILVAVILIIISFSLKNEKPKLTKKKMNSFCFIIPARDESKVIERLIISILNQTIKVNEKDIYVIVESREDPTVKICKNYKVTPILRQNNLQTKGFAIDDGLKQIKEKYDAYFIVDADNILDSKFVEELQKSYEEGYDIAIGYRNTKNGNDTLIAAASSITFSIINTVLNKIKMKKNEVITLSGTGFYISGKILNELDGYPFNSLTEDYELTLYSILNNISTTYNEKAIFYDEQPIHYKKTINQRKRWIKGYFTNRKKYLKLFRKEKQNIIDNSSRIDTIIGVKPYILLIFGIINWTIYFICNKQYIVILYLLLAIYLILSIITLLTFIIDKNIKLSIKMKLNMLWFHPIYLLSYILVAISILIKPNVKWERVEHNRNINFMN